MSAAVKPSRELCIMACTFCRDPVFWKWLNHADIECASEAAAKDVVLDLCKVASRNHLDTNPAAAKLFHQLVRAPFVFWRQEHQDQPTRATDWSAA